MLRLSQHFVKSSKNIWGSSYNNNNINKDKVNKVIFVLKNVFDYNHDHCVYKYKSYFSSLTNPFLPLLATLHRHPSLLDLPKKTAFKNLPVVITDIYLSLRHNLHLCPNTNKINKLLSLHSFGFSLTLTVRLWTCYTFSRLGQIRDLENENECLKFKLELEKTYNCNNSCKLEIRRHQSQSTDFCDTVKSASSEPQTEGLNMPTGNTNYVVGHDKNETYFYIKLRETTDSADSQAGSMAILQYNWVRPGLADLHHTEVPPEFQGRGIAKHLVLAALDSLCEENIIIRPTCTYIQKVLKDNPVPLHLDHIEKGFTF